MDLSNGSPMPLIDLKSRSTLTHDNNVVTLSKKAKVVPAPIRLVQQGVSPGLPNPDLDILGLAETKKPGENKQFCKVFDGDDLPIVCSNDDEDDILGVRHRRKTPASHYTKGEIKYTRKEALIEMAQNIIPIREETGCIIDTTCCPADSQYIQNLHFESAGHLGRGSFGEVDLCVDSKTRKTFVRKTIKKTKFRASEAIAPTTFDHPNITKVLGVVLRDSQSLQNSKIELYLEYGGTSLFRLNRTGREFHPSEIRNLAKQGLQGLKHMDLYKIMHLDIKPENICILEENGSLLLKITDFGTSRLCSDRLEFVGVTPEYLAPELCKYILQKKRKDDFGLSENDITGAVDVFAFALVIMYMYKGYHIMVKLIYNGQTTYKPEERKKLQDSLMDWMSVGDSSRIVQYLNPDECCSNMRGLLIGMTKSNHTERLTAKKALDFIQEAGKQSTQLGFSEKKEILDDTTFKTTARCVPGAQSLLDTSAKSFQDIKAARFPGHDTTECIGQPKLVPTNMLTYTYVESTQASEGSMIPIPRDVLVKHLQGAQSGQSTVTREANIQPPIINLQAEGLGTNRARHQPVHTPMEESPPAPANIPNFHLL